MFTISGLVHQIIEKPLSFHIFDEDTNSADDLLGSCHYDLRRLLHPKAPEGVWRKLKLPLSRGSLRRKSSLGQGGYLYFAVRIRKVERPSWVQERPPTHPIPPKSHPPIPSSPPFCLLTSSPLPM